MSDLVLTGYRGKYRVSCVDAVNGEINLPLLAAEAVTIRRINGKELYVRVDYDNGMQVYLPCTEVEGED